MDSLEKGWDFILVESSGSRSEVSLTEQGDIALKIFGVETNKKK